MRRKGLNLNLTFKKILFDYLHNNLVSLEMFTLLVSVNVNLLSVNIVLVSLEMLTLLLSITNLYCTKCKRLNIFRNVYTETAYTLWYVHALPSVVCFLP